MASAIRVFCRDPAKAEAAAVACPGLPRGAQAAFAFSAVNRFCVAVLYGRTGCLAAKNGCFRPGAVKAWTRSVEAASPFPCSQETVEAVALGLGRIVALYHRSIHVIPDLLTYFLYGMDLGPVIYNRIVLFWCRCF
jgi:hypothetical protein